VHEGQVYIVFDYLDGPDLRRWLRDHRPAWPEAARVAAAVADALAHAHARRIIQIQIQIQMRQLDKTPPITERVALQDRQGPTGQAFDAQLTRLGNILSVVSAVHWYCETEREDMDLPVWLPHEALQGAPPQRKLKTVQFQQAKPIWKWCLDKKAAYPTRFLTADNMVRSYFYPDIRRPVPVRPLGTVMEELGIGQAEYEALRKRYEGK